MDLGQIQDQKVHISSAGLGVAKNVMRMVDLERSLISVNNLTATADFGGFVFSVGWCEIF